MHSHVCECLNSDQILTATMLSAALLERFAPRCPQKPAKLQHREDDILLLASSLLHARSMAIRAPPPYSQVGSTSVFA